MRRSKMALNDADASTASVTIAEVRKDKGGWSIGLMAEDRALLRHNEAVQQLLRRRFRTAHEAHEAARAMFPNAYITSTGFRIFDGLLGLFGRFGNARSLLEAYWR